MTAAASGDAAPRGDGVLVLVADDEPNIRETISFILEMEGFQVVLAEDGVSAWEKIVALRPQVVLLDAMMPRLDGFSVCGRVRSEASLAGVRIVMVTALGQRADRERALAAGADRYVPKPFDEEELLRTIHELLESR